MSATTGIITGVIILAIFAIGMLAMILDDRDN